MVIELVTLTINQGQEPAFEVAMVKAKSILLEAFGSGKVLLARGVESASEYILQIEWDSIDAHIAFTKTEDIGTFRALVAPFLAERPHMEHFSPIP